MKQHLPLYRLFGCVATILLLYGWAEPGYSQTSAREKTKLSVSSFALDTLSLTPPTSAQLSEQLNEHGQPTWSESTPVESKAAWNVLPSGVDPGKWVSFVTVGFNEQGDAYAFMFDGPDGAISLAAHLPFRKVYVADGVVDWRWPFDKMLGTLRVHLKEQSKQPPRVPLALTVTKWRGDASQVVSSTKSNAQSSLNDARTLDPELVFAPVEAMIYGAAFEADWAPTKGQAEWSANCEVRVEDTSCSFRLTLKGPEGEQTFVKEQISWETYHENLVRIFKFADRKSGVSDFTQLFRGQVELLAIQDGRLACNLRNELTVFDLKSGKKLWTTEPTVKPPRYNPAEQYTARQTAKSTWQLLQYGRSLTEFDWETGAKTVVAAAAVDHPDHCAAADAGHWVCMSGGELKLADKETVLWEITQPDDFTAGPTVYGDLVFVGDATGKLQALSKKDGAVRWQQQLPKRLYGSITVDEDKVLVFSNEVESLLALDISSGKEVWRCPVGDVLQQAPEITGENLLLVTKSNKVLLADRKAGSINQEVSWPTWIVSTATTQSTATPLIACTDLAGKLTVLSLSDLQELRQIPLDMELAGPVLFVPEMPLKWPVTKADVDDENLISEINNGPVRKGSAWLATDSAGFLYILPQQVKE